MSSVNEQLSVPIESAADIVLARQKGRALAIQLGFAGSDPTVIAAAISEVARNIINHAKRGEIVLLGIHESGRFGIQVVATEPGTVSQQPTSVQVRAHLKIRCRYGQFVDLLGEMAHTNRLYSVDRFQMNADESGNQLLELWMSRYVLKQSRGGR